MNYSVINLFNQKEASEIRRELMLCSEWLDGRLTAKGGALDIKRNLQLNPKSQTYIDLESKISSKITGDIPGIADVIFPKKVINTLFSRTSTGMFYGNHVDSPYTNDGRRDFSFTLFLNNPKDYEGGELILSIPPERKSFKLNPGSIIIYPTKYLHEVKMVESGERVVCVGWIQSEIKNDSEREILSYVRATMQYIGSNEIEKSKTALNLVLSRLKKHFGD